MIPRAEPPEAPDPRLRTAIVTVGVVGAGLALGAWLVFGPRLASSVAIGATLAVANLWALARILAPLFAADSRGGTALAAAPKMLGLIVVVWLLMRQGVVSPMPMLVGFGCLPIGIVIGSLVSDRSPPVRTKED